MELPTPLKHSMFTEEMITEQVLFQAHCDILSRKNDSQILPQYLTHPCRFSFSKLRVEPKNLPPTSTSKTTQMGIFLVVQRLRLHASNAGGEGSIPGQGHVMQYSQRKQKQTHYTDEDNS